MSGSIADPGSLDPLDKRFIEVEQDGKQRQVAALNVGWAEERLFVRYVPPPEPPAHKNEELLVTTEREMWIERMTYFVDDMKFLLKLPHHRFWSQMVFLTGVHSALDSFLLNAPRRYDMCDGLFTEEMQTLLDKAHRFVFLVYLRLATHKESKMCHITPSAFADLIYDNYLFDIPKMLDLCVKFSANKAILQKMIGNVFTLQPKYNIDLGKAVSDLSKIFSTVLGKCGLESTPEENELPARRLSDSVSTNELPWDEMKDIVSYFIDTSATIYHFLDVYPAGCSAFHAQNFHIRIASFYSVFIPFLLEDLISRIHRIHSPETLSEMKRLSCRTSFGRTCLLNSFRKIIEFSCIQPSLDNGSVMLNHPWLDDYFQIMTSILPEKKFVADYASMFPFDDDVELFIQLDVQVDHNRLTYIKDCIQLLIQDSGVRSPAAPGACKPRPVDKKKGRSGEGSELTNGAVAGASSVGDLDEACAAPKVTGVKLDSVISQVKDLLPDLGDGFIEACLNYYNYQPEQVINAILEDSLPGSLKELDRNLVRKPITIQAPEDAVSSRRNIHDNDEFDVFNRGQVDLSRVHKGKWSNAHETSSDLSSKTELKNVTLNLSAKYEAEGVERDDGRGLYDDEYDDTYDEQIIGVNESVTWDELLERRPFVTPVVLRGSSRVKDDEIEGEPSDAEDDNSKDLDYQKEPVAHPRDEFVPNPEAERYRAAQKRGDFGSHSQDVKGRQKGQGQDTRTVRNRSNKEKNKSSHANHNRRAMADKKRLGGMFHV